MKQLLFLFLYLLPCLAWAQYPSNGNQKITLGEQTSADGLIYRGVASDTTLTVKSDTAAYFVLDTANINLYTYKASATGQKWRQLGADTAAIAYVNTYGTQTINGAKTFNNRLISTNAMHFVDTALSIVSFAKKTVQPNGIVGAGNGVLSTKTDYTTGTNPSSVNVDPTGRFLYVANFGSNTVSMYVINQTNGTLNTKTDYTTGTNPISVNVDPTGRFVYVVNYGSNTVSMYVINQTNGTLNTKTDYTTGTNPFIVNVDPTGRFVYVVNYGSNTVSMYVINQTNGTLNTKTDYTTGTQPYSVNVDPTGRFLYVANYGSATVSQYFIQSFSAGGYNVTGSLGISTDNPTEKLHVVGNARITGAYDVTTGSAANVFVTSNGVLQRSTSSIKYKSDVENYTKGLNEVMKLRPVTYKSINSNSDKIYAGFIAEELADLKLTELYENNDYGEPDAISYAYMVTLLTKAIQEQQEQITLLKKRLLILENK